MSKSVFQLVSELFQNPTEAVRIANLLDKAYADGTDPSYHSPFNVKPLDYAGTVLDAVRTVIANLFVAQNLAGLYAADTAANIMAALANGLENDGKVSEANYLEALRDLADDRLTDEEEYIAMNLANVTWRANQPGAIELVKDSETKQVIGVKPPLSRITREKVNIQFNSLDLTEKEKDKIQIILGAQIILAYIEENE